MAPEPASEDQSIRLPFAERAAREEEEADGVRRVVPFGELLEERLCACGLLLRIVEDQEQALLADLEQRRFGLRQEPGRPTLVLQLTRHRRAEPRLPGAACAGDKADRRRPGAAVRPIHDRLFILLATIERLDEPVVPPQRLEEVRFAVLKCFRELVPGKQRLRRGGQPELRRPRAVGDELLDASDQAEAEIALPDLHLWNSPHALSSKPMIERPQPTHWRDFVSRPAAPVCWTLLIVCLTSPETEPPTLVI